MKPYSQVLWYLTRFWKGCQTDVTVTENFPLWLKHFFHDFNSESEIVFGVVKILQLGLRCKNIIQTICTEIAIFLKQRAVCIFARLKLRFCDDIMMYLMYGTSLCGFIVELQKKDPCLFVKLCPYNTSLRIGTCIVTFQSYGCIDRTFPISQSIMHKFVSMFSFHNTSSLEKTSADIFCTMLRFRPLSHIITWLLQSSKPDLISYLAIITWQWHDMNFLKMTVTMQLVTHALPT